MDPVTTPNYPTPTSLLGILLVGVSYALSAALQPGPLQAFFIAKVAERGWQRTLPAAFAPLISDGPIALISILLLSTLPTSFRSWLGLAGGLLLLYFGWATFRKSKRAHQPTTVDSGTTPQTIGQAALINLLNPNPYLGWSLVMGPAVIAAWEKGPGLALALLLSFYFTMISTSLLLIYLIGQAILLKPNARQSLSLISGGLLVGLGFYFLFEAVFRLLSPGL